MLLTVDLKKNNMTNEELLGIYKSLVGTINILQPEVNALENTLKPSEEYVKFDTERVELAKECAKKDEQGKEVIVDNKYQIKDEEVFNKRLEVLKMKYKKVCKSREKQLKNFNKLLKKKV